MQMKRSLNKLSLPAAGVPKHQLFLTELTSKGTIKGMVNWSFLIGFLLSKLNATSHLSLHMVHLRNRPRHKRKTVAMVNA